MRATAPLSRTGCWAKETAAGIRPFEPRPLSSSKEVGEPSQFQFPLRTVADAPSCDEQVKRYAHLLHRLRGAVPLRFHDEAAQAVTTGPLMSRRPGMKTAGMCSITDMRPRIFLSIPQKRVVRPIVSGKSSETLGLAPRQTTDQLASNLDQARYASTPNRPRVSGPNRSCLSPVASLRA
jgi:hypothetical protein